MTPGEKLKVVYVNNYEFIKSDITKKQVEGKSYASLSWTNKIMKWKKI